VLPAPYASAGSCNNGINHYASQYTAITAKSTICPDVSNFYNGWIGLDGEIVTPSALSSTINFQTDHSAGYLDMEYKSDSGHLQIGWFEGTVGSPGSNGSCVAPGCARTSNGYKLYLERFNNLNYSVTVLSSLGYGGAVIYRIQYDAISQCWQAYYNYNTTAGAPSCGEDHSATAIASNEVGGANALRQPDFYVGMPLSEFGNANQNSNDALRVEGGNGYEPWDTSLANHTTATTSDTSGNPGYFYYEPYVDYYHILTYGGVS
jgi:hypothetical protein